MLVEIKAATAFQGCRKWHQWNGDAPSSASSVCEGVRRHPYLTWLLVFLVSCFGVEWVFKICLEFK